MQERARGVVRHPWISMPANSERPLVMHVDMNSCFATIEQQANPLLRGRPVAVAAYASRYGCVISPSYEAKAQGVKVGMRVWEAQAACPDIFIIQSNPPLYRDAQMRFQKIFESYTSDVTPKSIDEAVIDFRNTPIHHDRSMEDIGYEIKERVHEEIGRFVNVNVGIATNLREVYAGLELLDISGINLRNKARLNLAGIRTPLEFYDAPMWLLKKQVFQSITGYYWYLKLRGWEIEDFVSPRRSIGHDYSLQDRSGNPVMLAKFMMKLCEKAGRRLRRAKLMAEGIHVWVLYTDGDYWHHGQQAYCRLYTTRQIFTHAMSVFAGHPYGKPVAKMGVTLYDLIPYEPEQLGLFDGEHGDERALSRSLDAVNDRYGDMVVGSALLANMQGLCWIGCLLAGCGIWRSCMVMVK